MDLVIRAAVMYVAIFGFTRLLGRRELSQMQPFDLILLVVIGDLVQQGVTQNDLSITGMLLVIATVGVLQVGASYLSFRVRALRPMLEGLPVVVVEDGRLVAANLKRERLTEDDVTEEMRLASIESLDQVKWAVLETSGRMSFIRREG